MTSHEDRGRAAVRPEDVIAAVLEDHADIEARFARVDGAADPDEKAEAFRALTRKLVIHETAEQEVVHPLVKSTDLDLVDERLQEEAEAERQLAELESLAVTSPEFNRRLAMLRDAVSAHAEAEERAEHPLIDRTVDQQRLEQLARVFRAAEAVAPTHPHPHSPQSAVGNLAVGPFTALVDRVRDAVRAAAG